MTEKLRFQAVGTAAQKTKRWVAIPNSSGSREMEPELPARFTFSKSKLHLQNLPEQPCQPRTNCSNTGTYGGHFSFRSSQTDSSVSWQRTSRKAKYSWVVLLEEGDLQLMLKIQSSPLLEETVIGILCYDTHQQVFTKLKVDVWIDGSSTCCSWRDHGSRFSY